MIDIKSLICFILSIACLTACGETSIGGGLVGGVGPVEVALTVNSDGEVILSGDYTQVFGVPKILGVGWTIGFEKTLRAAKEKRYTLFILWKDEQGNIRQQQYEIGKRFKVKFDQEERVREIRDGGNGNLIVAVELISGFSCGNVFASYPTPQDIRNLRSIWESTTFRDLSSPGMHRYDVDVSSFESRRWTFEWCATDSTGLQEILMPLAVDFRIDNTSLPQTVIRQYKSVNKDGWHCHYWTTKLTRWQPRRNVKLEIRYELHDAIFDGRTTYPSGRYHQIIYTNVN